MGVPSRERLVLRHAWPDGDFSGNTRAVNVLNISECSFGTYHILSTSYQSLIIIMETIIRYNYQKHLITAFRTSQ